MTCAWNELLKLLPIWMRQPVDEQGKTNLLELRMRLGEYTELVTTGGSRWLNRRTVKEDLLFTINTASQYSPWSANSMAQGYITAPGGHRLGICGVTATGDGYIHSIAFPSSVCLRVARDFYGIASGLEKISGSIMIIGRPGSGKSTLLRDLIRMRSEVGEGAVCVVDEKGEIFPYSGQVPCFPMGKCTDVLTGCSKKEGIEIVMRNMCPTVIAVDEVTAETDCDALVHAGWCGVKLIATAHAADKREFYRRSVYSPLINARLFSAMVVLRDNRTWYLERMDL